ncbi:hypothetical protein C8Q74DRAFT_992209 [Fomes fomentarius]|nr:hypothetical protein C8Q74DRAFT_992209 [Fomes fomentarius]
MRCLIRPILVWINAVHGSFRLQSAAVQENGMPLSCCGLIRSSPVSSKPHVACLLRNLATDRTVVRRLVDGSQRA